MLEDEDHGDGPVHFATEVGAVHFAIYPAEAAGRAGERRSGGSVFPGFYVESLDGAAEALAGVGAPILTGHGGGRLGLPDRGRRPRTAGPSRSDQRKALPAR